MLCAPYPFKTVLNAFRALRERRLHLHKSVLSLILSTAASRRNTEAASSSSRLWQCVRMGVRAIPPELASPPSDVAPLCDLVKCRLLLMVMARTSRNDSHDTADKRGQFLGAVCHTTKTTVRLWRPLKTPCVPMQALLTRSELTSSPPPRRSPRHHSERYSRRSTDQTNAMILSHGTPSEGHRPSQPSKHGSSDRSPPEFPQAKKRRASGRRLTPAQHVALQAARQRSETISRQRIAIQTPARP